MNRSRKITIQDGKKRDATVLYTHPKGDKKVKYSYENIEVTPKRIIKFDTDHDDQNVATKIEKHGLCLLINSDPDIDLYNVGKVVKKANQIIITKSGKPQYSLNRIVIITGLDGKETKQKFVDIESNNSPESPIKWSGKLFDIKKVVRKLAFTRKVQLRHINGLTYDFLYNMAKILEEKKAMMMVGSGKKGTAPVILSRNDTPYRAFLQGETKGADYKLILHLSNLELKSPVKPEKSGD